MKKVLGVGLLLTAFLLALSACDQGGTILLMLEKQRKNLL